MRKLVLSIVLLVASLQVWPALAASQRDWAECNTSMNQTSVGEAACTRILNGGRETVSNTYAAMANRCYYEMDQSKLKEAVADCEAATHLQPRRPNAWNTLGMTLDRMGEPARAIEAFNTGLQYNPNEISLVQNRAYAWHDLGQDDRALADFDRALRVNPRESANYGNRGLVWKDRGEYDRALADFNQAISLNPKAYRLYAARGDNYRLMGNLEQALQDENRAIALDTKSAVSFSLRGDIYRYKGDIQLALADYNRAIELERGYTPALVGRGLTFERTGDAVHAREEFQKALESPYQEKIDISKSAIETARARLAALDSGAPLPVIPPAPARAASATSIPTPQALIPAVLPHRASQGRRVALVIGNSGYINVPALPNPERDANAVADALRAIGFDKVTLEINDTHEKLVNALRNFAHDAENAEWATVYYAGHGIEMNGVNYLIPVDAKLATDRDVQFEAVPFDQVMASLEGAKKLKLVLLDACRDNPFEPQMHRTAAPEPVAAPSTATNTNTSAGSRSIGRGLGEVKVSGATLVVFAAKQGQVALDGDGGDSPFTVAVTQRIATPGVEINKVFRLVRDDVMEASAGRQEPYTYGSLPGSEDFFFVQR
jgi:tetratricopeptide (TPR) repeat protein